MGLITIIKETPIISDSRGAILLTNSHFTIVQERLISLKSNSKPFLKKFGIGLLNKNQYKGIAFVIIFTISAVLTPR